MKFLVKELQKLCMNQNSSLFFPCKNGYLLDLVDTHFDIWFKCCSFTVGVIEMECLKIWVFLAPQFFG